MDADFEDWVRARTPELLRAAYLLTGSQPAAEDLVQDTMVKVGLAWRRISDSPDAYARKVLYHQQVDRWRRRRVTEIVSETMPDPGEPDRSSQVELRAVLMAALVKLPIGQRRVLVARFYEDLTEADSATALGCSIGTVKSQTFKALQTLRSSSPELAALLSKRLPTDV